MATDLTGGVEKAHFVRGMFDAIAGRYDLMNRLMTGWQDERWRRLAAGAVYPESVSVALDVGAGTGDLSFAMARRAPWARVIASDFSAGMLSLAGQKRGQVPGGERVLPVLGDATRLPAETASVDAVVSAFTLRNVDSLETALAEIARVLRPGGRVAILELTPVRHSPIPGFGRLFDLYFGNLVPLLGGVVSGRGFAYRYLPRSVKVFPDAPRLAEMLRAAGLAEVDYRLLALGTLALHTATKPGGAAGPGGASNKNGAGATELRFTAGAGAVASGQGITERDVHEAREWDGILAAVPHGHLLQTWEWGELKRETGWVPHRIVFERGGTPVAAASVCRRALPRLPLGIAYCQKGPALDYGDAALFREVLDRLAAFARRERCIFLKVDPDVEAGQPGGAAPLRGAGYTPAAAQVQTRSTVLVDLRGSDKELLGRMSATWRRYINKAGRDGVTVRAGTADDIERFFELMQHTERRQGYVIRPLWYYRSAFEKMHAAGIAELFLGDVEGQAEAAVVGCRLGKHAWYLWGGASDAGLKAHAPHLLQWHTMRWARDGGCETYDMWGAPDDPADKDDPLAGVYYFKRGFGGRHARMVGVFDYVTNPALYAAWEQALPRYITALRRLRGERGASPTGHE